MTSQKEIKNLFHYSEETGIFTWREDRHARKVKGLPAGWSTNSKGRKTKYVNIRVLGVVHKAHRLAWLYVHGEWPNYIDHIDGDGTNNRISNLRSVDKYQSAKNKPMQSNNSSGHIGVRFYNPLGKWLAKIGVNGRSVHLGYFDDLHDAVNSRLEAEKKYGFHKNHGRKSQ